METFCMLVATNLNPAGYAVKTLTRNNKRTQVLLHRELYLKAHNILTTDLVIDHLCRNKSCINVDHLELVTIAENTKRAYQAKLKRGVCNYGHTLNKETIYVVNHNGKTWNSCLTCRHISNKKAREKRKLHTT